MKKLFFILFFIPLVLFSSLFFYNCGGCTHTVQNTTNAVNASVSNTQNDVYSVITIQKGSKIELDSLEKFVQLCILFNLEQKKWMREVARNTSNKSTNSEPDDSILKSVEVKRKDFYKSFGITEREFTRYSNSHSKEFIEFLEKNPAYKKAYEESIP